MVEEVGGPPSLVPGGSGAGGSSGIGGILGKVGGMEGQAAALALLAAAAPVIPALVETIGIDRFGPIKTILGGLTKTVDKIEHAVDHTKITTWDGITKIAPPATLFYEMLHLGLGINMDKLDKDANDGIKTVDQILTFAMLMPILAQAMELIGKIPLASRWASGFVDSFGKLPEEMGLSWALGLVIDRTFEAAIGESINEAIRAQKRPSRIEWPVLRTLLKQHVLTVEEIRPLLENIGFPDHMIDMILKLADAQLPVGDIQQLRLHDLITDDEASTLISKLGFTDDDTKRISDLYIGKAETAAGNELRSTARQLFRNNLIDEKRYRAIRESTNAPALETDDDIEAVKLEHEVGDRTQTDATIKQQLLHNMISPQVALTTLIKTGHSQSDAHALLALWTEPHITPKRSLSESKVLSYLASKVITPEQATTRLQAMGLGAADIALLVAHPHTSATTSTRKRTPGLVLQAYMDDVIDSSDLESNLKAAGVSDADMPLWIQTAHYRYARRKRAPESTQQLSRQEITEAFKYGIFKYDAAHLALMNLGYNDDNATVLLEITSKGPFGPNEESAGMTVDQAIYILTHHGFTVYGPPDPTIAQAESVLGAAGYTWMGTGPSPVPVGQPTETHPPNA